MNMITTEAFGPEELGEIGSLFDDLRTTQASIVRTEEEKAQLASILLRLYGLRQLDRGQITKTALRLLNESPSKPIDLSLLVTGAPATPAHNQNP